MTQRNCRLQHVLSHMNHHIHPVVDANTGERRPLKSCQAKNRPKECKAGFPLDNEMTEVALLVFTCIAQARGLPSSGPRSRIGSILVARNEPNLNAAPTAWAEFSGDNGDIKFPLRVPILPETHEVLLYDAKSCCKKRCCDKVNELDLAYEVQVGQAVTAGYVGGYSAKMQSIGRAELMSMVQGVLRKAEVSSQETRAKAYLEYSRRLVRDLEGKGIVRTAVEATNLNVNTDENDVLRAECIRTFPTVTFPATLLLKREEIETGKVAAASVIAAVGVTGGTFSRRAFLEAPFDLMYGFRGRGFGQRLLSPYEMIW